MKPSFSDYIQQSEQEVRPFLAQRYQGDKLNHILQMNLPFELRPKSSSKPKKGALLTHGFLSSPYMMRALGQGLAEQGFLVRAPLLPGHGSSFEELDHYTWQDWLNTVRFAYHTLAEECEEIILGGFSIGATLSLLLSLEELKQNPASKIQKLILLAPCLGISALSKSFPFLSKWHLTRFLPSLFCTEAEKEHWVSYKRFSIQSVAQIVKMLNVLKPQLKSYADHQFPLPTYVVASKEDATVKFAAILDFVQRYLNTHSRFRVYANTPLTLPAEVPHTLLQANSLAANIKAISHVAIPVASNDPYFGADGTYYGHLPKTILFSEPPAFHPKNIRRLTYNPDYLNLQNDLFQWIQLN